MKMGLTFTSLKLMWNLIKDIENLRTPLTGLARISALFSKSILANPSISAGFDVTGSAKILSIWSFYVGSKLIVLVGPKLP